MYEYPGISGLSHMFEHMMFKGTETLGTRNFKKEKALMARIDTLHTRILSLKDKGIPDSADTILTLKKRINKTLQMQRNYIKKNEIWELYSSNGADNLNAWTGDDLTAYIVTLPAHKTELFYWVESDRMKNRVLREFYSERAVVAQERKMRYDNKPVNRYWERLNAFFYMAHPYRLPTIGWESDIAHYTRAKLQRFISRYYTPDNALIVLAGNIDTVGEIKKIKNYFGSIAPSAKGQRDVVTREPPAIGERTFTVYDDATPRIDILFQTPGYPHDDLFALDIVEGMLSGRSGRLYSRLVKQTNLCTNAGAGNTFRQHNGYFHIWARLREDTDPDSVMRIVHEEIVRLRDTAADAHEIQRTKNNITMHFVKGLSSLEGISDRLAWFESLNSWRDLYTYPDKIQGVTPLRVKACASRYFDWNRKTTGRLLPKSRQPGTSTAHDSSNKRTTP
jgi:predicted Zn-dependent peptidase